MAGGQQASFGAGTIVALGGDNNFAVSGTAATGTAGSLSVGTRFVTLNSRKTRAPSSATVALSGSVSTFGTGTLVFTKAPLLVGSLLTGAQGSLVYQGRATISWNAVTTISDGSSITDLAGYRILHGTATNNYSESVTLGIVTSYVWSGLANHTTHYFVVQAYDTAVPPLFSGNSAEVNKGY